jgi:hypothetical protein
MNKTIEAPLLINPATGKLDASRLRQLCLDLGAEDAGLVELERPALADQRDDIPWFFPVYVVAGSDAEAHVARRFPRKRTKQVSGGLRGRSIDRLLKGLRLVFQPGKAEGVNTVFHFTFTGTEQKQATIVIRDQKLRVEQGHVGTPDVHVTADSETWLGLGGEPRVTRNSLHATTLCRTP